MNGKVIEASLAFLARTQISGAEAQAMLACQQWLQAIADGRLVVSSPTVVAPPLASKKGKKDGKRSEPETASTHSGNGAARGEELR